MSSLILMLVMQTATTQFVVSTKAGLVNYVQGAATVKPAMTVPAGQVIATGPGGAVELLLNPGSYLRMGENSRVVLERVELYDIAVRILEGSMVITANGFDKELPLQVANSEMTMEVIKDGIYLFADGKVVVVNGKIRNARSRLTYGKGYEISGIEGYRSRKVKTFTTALELWSQKRDADIARANENVARSLRRTPDLPVASFLDVWLWYPAFGSFIYMPGRGYRSPYGHRYQTAGEIYSNNSSASSGGWNPGGRSNPSFGGGETASGGAGNGGGGFGGGSAASAAPAAPQSSDGPSASAPSPRARVGK